jgi:hypothetical protein
MIPEHGQEEIHKTGHSWIDISVAGCALVVSITSLFVAIRHERSMERMAEANARLVEANSWPLLQRYQSDIGELGARVFSLNVANFGVGPAKVESLEVFWKGSPVHNPRELAQLCCVQGKDTRAAHTLATSAVMGSVLRTNEVRHVIEFTEDTHDSTLSDRLHDALRNIVTRACYCSVFDECWVSDLHTLHPPSVRQCPVPGVPFGG